MTLARIGWNADFKFENAPGTDVMISMGQCQIINIPQDVVDAIEATTHKSAGRRKEYVAGLVDGGEVEMRTLYMGSSPAPGWVGILENALASGSVRKLEFYIPDQQGNPAWKIEAFGYCKAYHADVLAPNEAITATVVWRITGEQTQESATLREDLTQPAV